MTVYKSLLFTGIRQTTEVNISAVHVCCLVIMYIYLFIYLLHFICFIYLKLHKCINSSSKKINKTDTIVGYSQDPEVCYAGPSKTVVVCA